MGAKGVEGVQVQSGAYSGDDDHKILSPLELLH